MTDWISDSLKGKQVQDDSWRSPHPAKAGFTMTDWISDPLKGKQVRDDRSEVLLNKILEFGWMIVYIVTYQLIINDINY